MDIEKKKKEKKYEGRRERLTVREKSMGEMRRN